MQAETVCAPAVFRAGCREGCSGSRLQETRQYGGCFSGAAKQDSHPAGDALPHRETIQTEEEGTITVYGYIRVSTREQNEARQRIAMQEAGVPEENVFMDRQSGRNFRRPQYRELVQRMGRDDLLYVKSIDRLGRNYGEILEQWRILTKEKGVDIVVIDMPLLDTRRGKDLMGTFLSDIVLQVLSFVAENERVNIRQRQAEGIAAAKARGVQFGRPSRPLPENFPSAYRRWKEESITGTAAAKECGMSLSTFRYRAAIYEKTGA